MTDEPERHNNAGRNRVINQAVMKLDGLINHHDPEIDVPIKDGVWGALDRLCDDLEKAARAAGYAAGIAAAANWLEPSNPREDWTEYARDCHQNAKAIRALAPSTPAPVTVQETLTPSTPPRDGVE